MGKLHLITGYKGEEHIQSADQGSFNASFFGDGEFVMEAGNQFEASIMDNNTVRILDGDALMKGRHLRIEPNTYEDVTITTGTAGTNRIDLIVMEYKKDTSTDIESAELVVIKGTETSGTATDPEYTDGDILSGATFNQMPLYRVRVEGVVLAAVEPLFDVIPTYKTLAETYASQFKQTIEDLKANNILDTMEEVDANTQENMIAGALALKELSLDVSEEIEASKYTHPSYTARTGKPTANQTPAFGGKATVSQIISNATGHVTSATDRTITIPSTLSNGTETAGLIKTSSAVTSNSGYTACPVISGVPYYKDTNTTYSAATTSANGLMTSAMVTKLNGIATGATATSVVNNLTSTSTTSALSAYQGKVLYDSFSKAHSELVNALAYSGLGVTEDMTFSEIAEVLAVAFPELYYLYNNGTISALVGSFVQGTKVTSSNTAIAPTFNDDNITLATTSNAQECSVVSSSTVDLTDYSTLGCTILRNDEEIQYTVDISQLSGSYYVGLRHIYQDSLISEWLAVASSQAFNSTYMVAYNNFLYHASPTDDTKTLVIKEIWLK